MKVKGIAQSLSRRTGINPIKSKEFVREFEGYLRFVSAYFNVHIRDVAHQTLRAVQRAEMFDEMEANGISPEEIAKMCQNQPTEDPRHYAKREEELTEYLDSVFGK